MDHLVTSHRLCLQKMTMEDAEAVCRIYNNEQVKAHFDIETIETLLEKSMFVERIIANSNFIWTIRLLTHPETIIGDCALHDIDIKNYTIEIGGSLLPQHWGCGIMAEAFTTIIQFAAANLNIKYVVGRTSRNNRQAICCLQKLGFKTVTATEQEVQMVKHLLPQSVVPYH